MMQEQMSLVPFYAGCLGGVRADKLCFCAVLCEGNGPHLKGKMGVKNILSKQPESRKPSLSGPE